MQYKTKIYMSTIVNVILSVTVIVLFLFIKNIGNIKNIVNNASFTATESGLYYQYKHHGDGEKPNPGDMLQLKIKNCIEKSKEVILDSEKKDEPFFFPYPEDLKDKHKKRKGFIEALSMMKQGDHIKFRLGALKLYENGFAGLAMQCNVSKDDLIELDITLEKCIAKDEYKKIMDDKKNNQHKKDLELIESYLKEKNIKAECTETGLHYIIDNPGKGMLPMKGQQLTVHYTGKLLDGKVFETSLGREPYKFKVGSRQVMAGWDEGLMLLRPGAKARFFIPSALAYGEQAIGEEIPANSVMLFDIELIGIEN